MAPISQLPKSGRGRPESNNLEDEKLRLVRVLLDSLGPEARTALALELVEGMRVGKSEPSPTGVLATVLQFIPRGETVTAARLRQEVSDRGLQVAPKEVYNAIGYLARTGKLRRVGYGRYLVDGVEIGTSDDLGGEMTPTEDISDDSRE